MGHQSQLTRERALGQLEQALAEGSLDPLVAEVLCQTVGLMFQSRRWEHRFGACNAVICLQSHIPAANILNEEIVLSCARDDETRIRMLAGFLGSLL